MSTEKTDQNIQDEDWAWRLNGSGLKMPFHYRVNADMKGGFTVSLNRLTRNDVENVLVFLRDHHEQWLQMSSRRGWSENMAHQFAVGDIVRLNGNTQEAEVIGLKEATGSEGPLLHVHLGGTKMYFPVHSVTLVRSGGAAQVEPSYPSKLET